MGRPPSEKLAPSQESVTSFMRLLVATLILVALGQPAKSAIVYHCVMDVFVSVGQHGLRHYPTKRFTMLVDENEVELAGDNFIGEKADIVFFSPKTDYWEARTKYKFMFFSNGRLNFVEAVDSTRAFNAKCEKL